MSKSDYILKLVTRHGEQRITEYIYASSEQQAKDIRKERFAQGNCVIGIIGTREEIDAMESHFTKN